MMIEVDFQCWMFRTMDQFASMNSIQILKGITLIYTDELNDHQSFHYDITSNEMKLKETDENKRKGVKCNMAQYI